MRLRPVLMTALAMIIGMLPMSLGLGEGGEQNAALGRAVIGGLLGATLATLFFVPRRLQRARGDLDARERDPDLDAPGAAETIRAIDNPAEAPSDDNSCDGRRPGLGRTSPSSGGRAVGIGPRPKQKRGAARSAAQDARGPGASASRRCARETRVRS